MDTYSDILRAAGPGAELARRLGVTRQVVSKWIARNTLPVEYFRPLCQDALSWRPPMRLTCEDLCRIAERAKQKQK